MNDCIFCEILAGHGEASFVYRDESIAAFLDIQPVNDGHTLVVPIAHAPYLGDLDPDTGAAMFALAHRIAVAMRRSVPNCDGVSLYLVDGEKVGQDILHTHIHVFPRFKDDGFSLRFPAEYGRLPERAELDVQAERLREALSVVS